MHLVQLLLPLFDSAGRAFPAQHYVRVSADLTERFGGLTAYTRAPAAGFWKDAARDEQDQLVRDDVVVYEVMVASLDRPWWGQYRETLRRLFAQDELVVRAQRIELL